MEDLHKENVLAEIEENFQESLKENEENKLDESEFIDEAIEEFDVVDSWEVGSVDDIQPSDNSYGNSRKRPRDSSYSRRRDDKFSRRDRSYDNYRKRKIPYRRHRSRSRSKPSDYRSSPRRSLDRRTTNRHSSEHLKESQPISSHKNDKLPDLKCTTSLETGEVNVVLLTEEKIVTNLNDEHEKSLSDSGQKKNPTLLKNPFAYASLKKRISRSPEKIRARDFETSPRHSIERNKREFRDSKSFNSRSRERSLSPSRLRSIRRTSPYLQNKRNRRRSSSKSPDRYPRRRPSFEYRRSRDSGRWRSPSREGSILSRVSSKSSLSFISRGGRSPEEHERKQSPLRPFTFYNPSRQNNEGYVSTSEDFNHKLSILLKEGKQKQPALIGDSGPSMSTTYNATWKPDNWNSAAETVYPPIQDQSVNFIADAATKPNYNTNPSEFPGYSPGQYNQAYYNNTQPQNYSNAYVGSVDTNTQMPYNYGNQYANQTPNQYYPQTTPASNFPSTSYVDHSNIGPYQDVSQPPPPPVTESIVIPQVNLSQQHYNMPENSLTYVNAEPQPGTVIQQNAIPEISSNSAVKTRRARYSTKRLPTRTDVPVTYKEDQPNEEDPMRTPPPPVISDTWREIESGGKNLSNLLKEASKKREVIAKCEGMLQKLISNDPTMERFKVFQCDHSIQFSLKDDSKPTNSTSRNSKTARRLAKALRNQSPLLRRRNNPKLQFLPWMVENRAPVASELNDSEKSVPSSVKTPKSILKNPLQVNREETCPSCIVRRDSMVCISTQTDETVTKEVGVQVESNWQQENVYYSNNQYNNSNEQMYPVWYRR